ncbi:helix-turn-helix transcriptional regulator [Cohnella kolymensis]|uniref:helix-turn-helix transcriptional regulator n=1 Tax=Cohnella kolymensis TaxID=1590652 RepID=UPI002E1615A2
MKPLKSEQFLDSVRSVLLHLNKRQTTEADWASGFHEHFRMDEPRQEQTELLNRLFGEPFTEEIGRAAAAADAPLPGPYYAVIRIQLLDNVDGKRAAKDTHLLQYGALNIVSEVLEGQWNSVNFYTGGTEISAILQWREEQYADDAVNKIDQLDMLGRSLHHNIRKYLSTSCVVGISQILKGPQFINLLNQQACRAIGWHGEHRDHYVFYYGDFKWNFSQEEPTPDEVSAQHNLIVDKAKEYILGNYARKGLTLHVVAQNNHVSPNYLSYLFKKNMGINLWEYVIKLRMEESKRLLQQTDMRRYEVAERVGYESPEHFSKIFKKYYGISPSELKK